MKARFTDYSVRHARMHADRIDPEADARLFSEPPLSEDPTPEEFALLRKRISDVHNATCNGYATLGLPLKLRVLVSTILAASNGETTFKASYRTLVGLLFQQGDGRTLEAKKSEVRRLIVALHKWQEKTKITLCTIRQGGRTKRKNGEDEYHDTEFDLVFLDAIAKALIRNPEPEKMRAAVRLEIGEMMKLPAFDGRWRAKEPTPEELRDRHEKAAKKLLMKACHAEAAAGRNPKSYFDEQMAELKRLFEAEFSEIPPPEGNDEKLSEEKAEDNSRGGVSDPTHPPVSSSELENSVLVPLKNKERVLKTRSMPTGEPPRNKATPTAEDLQAWNKLTSKLRAPEVQVATVDLAEPQDSYADTS